MIKAISKSQAFAKGADLWIISPAPLNPWAGIIDWHLGFHLRKLKQKSKTPIQLLYPKDSISSFLKEQNQKLKTAPLLVESSSLLPNLWTLELAYKANTWLSDIKKIWALLNKPSVRLFAPLPVTKKQIEKEWSDTLYVQYITSDKIRGLNDS